MATEEVRGDEVDLAMCKEYLQSLPDDPTIASIDTMVAWKPNLYDEDFWQSFLNDEWRHKLRILKMAGARDIEGLEYAPLKYLVKRHIDQAVEIQGKVSSMTQPFPYREYTTWECESCGAEWRVGNGSGRRPIHSYSECAEAQKKRNEENKQKYGEDYEDEKIHRPKLYTINGGNADLIDAQVITIQEIPEDGDPNSAIQIMLPALMKGTSEDMWMAYAGQRVKLRGVFRVVMKAEASEERFDNTIKFFEIFSINPIDHETTLSPEDVEFIKAEMAQPGFYKKVVRSIAPHIYGMKAAKETIALVLASIGTKRPLKVLWVGDPGTGKSELLEIASDLAPSGHYTSMANTSYRGLTTTNYRDEMTGKWAVTPGLFAYAKFVGIDELQIAEDKEAIKAMNDVIESGQIRYALTGNNYGKIKANVAMIMACNPHTGKVSDSNIHELLAFLGRGVPAFVSRMALIYFFKDNPDDETDSAIADAILKNSGEDPRAKYLEDWIEYRTPLDWLLRENQRHYFGENTLKKIFKFVSTLPIKELPDDYHERLKEHYKTNRKDIKSRINKLMTPRYLRHSVKLAQARARLQGLQAPTWNDIDPILDLQADSMETAAFDPKSATMDGNLLNDNRSKRQIAKESTEQQFWEAFRTASMSDGGATIDTLKFYLCHQQPEGLAWEENAVENYVRRLTTANRIVERVGGRLERIDGSL